MDVTTIRNVITKQKALELYEAFKNKKFFIDFLNKELIRNEVGFIITDGIIRFYEGKINNINSYLGDVSYYVDEDFFGFEFFNTYCVALSNLKYESLE